MPGEADWTKGDVRIHEKGPGQGGRSHTLSSIKRPVTLLSNGDLVNIILTCQCKF